MGKDTYDLVVLGGGNAVTVAMDAARAGWRVALIEESALGGTCPNRGCIPSKLLLGYAEAAQHVRDAGRFHVQATLGEIDTAKLVTETLTATGATDGKIEGALPEGLTLFRGRGRFVADKVIEVNGEQVRGERVLIATGSRPRRLPLDVPYWTSDDVFRMSDVPKSITIVGGGYIGCELASFFHGVGVETLLVHRGKCLLAPADEEIQPVFQAALTERIPTRFETEIAAVEHDGSVFHMTLRDVDGNQTQHTSEALLLAIGRVPNTDGIGLETTDIGTDARGFVQADDHMRTSVDGVYALGDVIGRYSFTHSAAYEAQYLSRVFLHGETDAIDYGPMPHAVFSHPEVAGVGATEQELRADGVEFVRASLPYTTAAKGRAIKERHGLCKFLLAPSGEILGFHIVGRDASVLIHEVIPVMKWRNHISSITGMIHIHPSLPEVVRNTARKAAALVG